MSKKEIKRISTITRLVSDELTYALAATRLGISERHVYRLADRFKADGEAGLIHRLRGRPSNFRRPPSRREEVVRLYRESYSDYGPTLFCEALAERHDIVQDPETARRWLYAAGLWAAKTRKHPHRKKRPRRAAVGELVQFDGSIHDWLEGRGPQCVLLHAIDDASNRTFLRFAPSENTIDAMRTMRDYIKRFGVPRALYVDGGGVYRDDSGVQTQFARAMQDVDVAIIMAHSPQAKGRVERGNRTHQDRLIKAMRLERIATIDDANAFLERKYLADHNARFASTEGLPDVHRDPSVFDLDKIFSIRETRFVANDYTIQLDGHYYQLLTSEGPLPPPRREVTLRRYLDGSLHISWHDNEIAFAALNERPRKRKPVAPVVPTSHAWLTQNQRIKKREKQQPPRQRLMTPP